eukprot:GFKZ01000222.1.p1 GENE.GFKZ01000222.1~~GFKZ01000222.1.p1  ORF type:complete len:202 (-),score=30.87 GFKZ01000222.1:106-711(-)
MFSLATPVVKASAGQRRAVLAHATPDRRAVVSGFVAGVASLVAGKASADVTPVDLFDDRKRTGKGSGFDLIYEARDLDLPQNQRDGISQFKKDLAATKARYSASAKRIEGPLGDYINKSYWTEAREELRRQVGNFRQDLNTIASSKASKVERKEAQAKAKALIGACEELDYAIQTKDLPKAQKLYGAVKKELSTFTSSALA